jgi:hypothetical protein
VYELRPGPRSGSPSAEAPAPDPDKGT